MSEQYLWKIRYWRSYAPSDGIAEEYFMMPSKNLDGFDELFKQTFFDARPEMQVRVFYAEYLGTISVLGKPQPLENKSQCPAILAHLNRPSERCVYSVDHAGAHSFEKCDTKWVQPDRTVWHCSLPMGHPSDHKFDEREI